MTALDTDWQVIQTAASGLAAQGPMDPIQAFRIRRMDDDVLVDLSGLRLDDTRPGLCNLGHLPDWGTALIPQQIFWVNDHPTSLHASMGAIHLGRVLYWTGQVQDGRIVVNRPAQLAGGFTFKTGAAFPHHLATKTKEKLRWMP